MPQNRTSVSLALDCLISSVFMLFSNSYVMLTFSQTSPGFTCLQYNSFEDIVGKGEIARNVQFLHFHSVFYSFGELSVIFIKVEIVVCKLFQFRSV